MADFDEVKFTGDALAPAEIPVKHAHTDAGTYPNVSFFFYDAASEAGADNASIEDGYYPQVDIWAKTETDAVRIRKQAVQLLAAAGFEDIHWQELYESDTKIYHVPIRAVYVNNLQGE